MIQSRKTKKKKGEDMGVFALMRSETGEMEFFPIHGERLYGVYEWWVSNSTMIR